LKVGYNVVGKYSDKLLGFLFFLGLITTLIGGVAIISWGPLVLLLGVVMVASALVIAKFTDQQR
jgi:hypothetical protein